jgi:FtsH-binding integral membrane protein
MAAIMKTVALGQQAGETDSRSAGRELVGSTCMGAVIALVMWLGLSLWPSLWMLVLWLMAAALWTGAAMTGARRTRRRPSFWSNALVTSLILFGPAIEDSASGKSVLQGAVMRTTLFIAVSFYAWGTIWLLEHWRSGRATTSQTLSGETST